LPVGDRERPVQVSTFGEFARDELGSWHPAQGPKKARIMHTLGDYSLNEIFLVVAHEMIMHSFCGYSPAGGWCAHTEGPQILYR